MDHCNNVKKKKQRKEGLAHVALSSEQVHKEDINMIKPRPTDTVQS